MADFNKPVLADAYADVLQAVRDLCADLAKGLDGTGTANAPTNALRWNSANKRFEKYNGTSWVELIAKASDKYDINVDRVDGYDAGNASGNIPVSNGIGNSNLNADMVDGVHLSGLAVTVYNNSQSMNTYTMPGLYEYDPNVAGSPTGDPNHRVLSLGADNRASQIALNSESDRAFFRRKTYAGWQSWRELWHNGNFDPVANANLAAGKTFQTFNTPSDQYALIATLPASTLATYDKLMVELVGGGWAASATAYLRCIFGNRAPFTVLYDRSASDAYTLQFARIIAQQMPDGSVGIYLYAPANMFSSCIVRACGTQVGSTTTAIQIGDLSTTVPGGTRIFDSYDATPNMYPSPYAATHFEKAIASSPCLIKTAASTLSILAGTKVMVNGKLISFATDTAVVMPTMTSGTDYAVYVCTDGSIRADANWTAPTGYNTSNSRKIGGFHYGLVAPGTTVAGGGFATTGAGMYWAQADVDKIAGINQYSIWDLRFRPACPDPRGMVLVSDKFWCDIYLLGVNHTANGTSAYNQTIADGGSTPKMPASLGNNGEVLNVSGVYYYANGLTWYAASEIFTANGKRLLSYEDFAVAAYGVNENTNGAADPVTTKRESGYTSLWGIEQAAGRMGVWGADVSMVPDSPISPLWQNTGTVSRGKAYLHNPEGLCYAIFGGYWSGPSAHGGSRSTLWSYNPPWAPSASFGARGRSDHLVLF